MRQRLSQELHESNGILERDVRNTNVCGLDASWSILLMFFCIYVIQMLLKELNEFFWNELV